MNVRQHIVAGAEPVPGRLEADESDFVAVASAAGLLIQIGSAPCAVSNHAAVAAAERRR